MIRRRTALSAALLALAMPATATREYTGYQAMLYAPIAGELGCLAQGLLSIPPAWAAGDAGALVLGRRGSLDARRDATVAALVAEGAAVLEITVGAPTDCGGRAARDPQDEVSAALAALREYGSGLVVALGFGEGTDTVQPSMGVAAAAIGERHATFRGGTSVASEESWGLRSMLFGALLGKALAQPNASWSEDGQIAASCSAVIGTVETAIQVRTAPPATPSSASPFTGVPRP